MGSSLAQIAANIQWADAQGAASLYVTNIRFGNWVADSEAVGPSETGYGTGLTFKFVVRTDQTATFELAAMPAATVPAMLRLKLWLDKGGSCTVNTMDANNASFACTKKPGYQIAAPALDRVSMLYRFQLGLRNTSAAPMICSYLQSLGVGFTITVTPPQLVLGPDVGTQGPPLVVQVTDASGNIVSGLVPSFQSSDPTIATVDPVTGVATAVSGGSCSILVSIAGTQVSVPVAVQIQVVPRTLSLSPGTLSFTQTTYTAPNPTLGKSGVPSQRITATLLNSSGQPITVTPGMLLWTITGSGVSTVDNGDGTLDVTPTAGSQSGTIKATLASDNTISASTTYTTVASVAAELIPNTYTVTLTAVGQTAPLNIKNTLSQYGEDMP